MRTTSMPGIIHIGYMRSGSTYLRSYFSQHPDIHWTRKAWFFQLEPNDEIRKQKYLRFFNDEKSYSCFIDMYECLCLGYVLKDTPQKDYSNSIHPEWSADWAIKLDSLMDGTLIVPDHNEVARRIRHSLPHARILIVLRNQYDWFRSMYLHYLPYFPVEHRLFVDFLNTLEGKSAIYAASYDRLLEAYAAHFGRENMHVMILEEIANNEEDVLRRLCNFLDIPFLAMDQSKADQNEGLAASHSLIPEEKPATLSILQKLGSMFRKPSSNEGHLSVLTAMDEAFIHSSFAVSNFRTSKWLGVDLAYLGYPI